MRNSRRLTSSWVANEGRQPLLASASIRLFVSGDHKVKPVALAAIALIAGCASNSGVIPIGKDTFMVSRQAATGFSGSGTLKAEAFQEATKFCERRGKTLQVVNTYEASPPYILTNFPKAEIQFMCLDGNDLELGRPRLTKTPDSVIEVQSTETPAAETNNQKDLYAELLKLDDLRKRGIITEAEFETLKKKLLAE